MAASTETLPEMENAYDLSEESMAAYRRDGHVLLRGVCSPEEVAAYRDLFREEMERRAKTLAPMAERDTYGKAFVQVWNLWREDERFKRFVFAHRFARIAAELLGVDKVRLYHDQALFKEAGGGFTPWHQDQQYWPLDTDNTVTMWMPLVDVSAAMGTMHFASGSHKDGFLGDMPISDDSEEAIGVLVQEKGYAIHNHGAMKAGDATFHSGWVLHGAPGNESDRTREVMTIIYYPDGVRLLEPDSESRRLDFERWYPEGVAGEPAAGSLTPVLYSRV